MLNQVRAMAAAPAGAEYYEDDEAMGGGAPSAADGDSDGGEDVLAILVRRPHAPVARDQRMSARARLLAQGGHADALKRRGQHTLERLTSSHLYMCIVSNIRLDNIERRKRDLQIRFALGVPASSLLKVRRVHAAQPANGRCELHTDPARRRPVERRLAGADRTRAPGARSRTVDVLVRHDSRPR